MLPSKPGFLFCCSRLHSIDCYAFISQAH
jgi:hypothetical protein